MNQRPAILVADDEMIVLSLVRDCLEDDGFEVHVASCGADAEKILQDKHIDLLVSDIRMPDFDGIELLRRAKRKQENIGAIFMTGFADVESAKEAIKEGAMDYLMKPFDIAEIRSAVKGALAKKAEMTDKSAEEGIDRMTRLTILTQEANDLPSLVRMMVEFSLLQTGLSAGAGLYWQEDTQEFVALLASGGDTTQADIKRVKMDESPFYAIDIEAVKINNGIYICDGLDSCPCLQMMRKHAGLNTDKIFPPGLVGENENIVGLPIIRNESVYAIVALIVRRDEIEQLQNSFKVISLAAQQTALSIENLQLLSKMRSAYSQLQDMQEEAQRLENMAVRGEIAAEIGHELKNFLGVVYGNLNLMDLNLQKGAVEKYPQYMKAIISNLDKMKVFTQDLMKEAKLTAKREIIDVVEHLQELLPNVRAQERFSNVELVTELPENPVMFETDPLLFQQLAYNLINNAADACRKTKKKRVLVSIQQTGDPANFRFVIHDTGSGFDQKQLDGAFKTRFTTKKDGNGFGLLVCKRIIDAHSGDLKIDSEVGKGTKITITFPIAGSESPSSTQPIPVAKSLSQ